jgi:SAM-dependent methyltransferase
MAHLGEFGEKQAWYENESFWEAEMDIIFNQTKVLFSFFEVSNLLSITGNSKEQNLCVLDLCCGVGRHAIELARRGHSVAAVDITETCIERGRERARNLKTPVSWIRADAREFVMPDAFQIIINLFNSFGYCENEADDARILMNCYQSLQKGGKLLMELLSKETVALTFQESYSFSVSGMDVEVKNKVMNDWSWIETEWSFVKNGVPKELVFSQRLYAASELRELLKECGFKDICIYGNLKGRPYDHKAKSLVIVSRK